MKGTWDRGGFGPKATATGVHPASRAATGREAVPANHVRQRWESSARAEAREGSYGAGFTKREKRERSEAKEINPTARTGERCSASQYVNKSSRSNSSPRLKKGSMKLFHVILLSSAGAATVLGAGAVAEKSAVSLGPHFSQAASSCWKSTLKSTLVRTPCSTYVCAAMEIIFLEAATTL